MAEYVLTNGTGPQITTDLATEAELSAHNADTTAVHGITDTAALVSVPAEPEALTADDGGTVDATYGQDEADVIANLVVRVGELEAALIALGLLAEPA